MTAFSITFAPCRQAFFSARTALIPCTDVLEALGGEMKHIEKMRSEVYGMDNARLLDHVLAVLVNMTQYVIGLDYTDMNRQLWEYRKTALKAVIMDAEMLVASIAPEMLSEKASPKQRVYMLEMFREYFDDTKMAQSDKCGNAKAAIGSINETWDSYVGLLIIDYEKRHGGQK